MFFPSIWILFAVATTLIMESFNLPVIFNEDQEETFCEDCASNDLIDSEVAFNHITSTSNPNSELMSKHSVMGYFPNWSHWRLSPHNYGIDNIPGNLLTHLIYAFIRTDPDGRLINAESSDDCVRLSNLKSKYSHLKILVSVGGYTYSQHFKELVRNPSSMLNFAVQCYELLETYGLDGIDIDWEYPSVEEREDFIRLIMILRYTLDHKGKVYLLTIAVPAGFQNLDPGFDIERLNGLVDYFGAMTYNFHGSWEDFTGHNSPLYGDANLNSDAVITHLVDNGADPNKIVLGIPFFGRSYKLQNPNDTYVGAQSYYGGGNKGFYTQEAGTLAYFEIQNLMNISTRKYDGKAKAHYLFTDEEWISYENELSISYKIDYVCDKKLAGIMIWEISMDTTDMDLLNAINMSFESNPQCGIQDTRREYNATTLTEYYVIPTLISSIEESPISVTNNSQLINASSIYRFDFESRSDIILFESIRKLCNERSDFSLVLISFPNNCSRYIDCSAYNKPLRSCPQHLYFNQQRKYCDWPRNVNCTDGNN